MVHTCVFRLGSQTANHSAGIDSCLFVVILGQWTNSVTALADTTLQGVTRSGQLLMAALTVLQSKLKLAVVDDGEDLFRRCVCFRRACQFRV